VGSARPAETDEAGLASMMVGRSVVLRVEKAPAHPTDVVLSIEALEVEDDRHQRAVRGLELSVRAGEILGVAGVQGNGQRELVEAICGMRPPKSGRITIAGRDTTDWDAREVNALGVAHIPEDREKHGLVGSFPIADELVLNRYDEAPFARHGQRDFAAVARHAEALVRRFDVRTPSVQRPSNTLSGGNKQKLIVARELGHRARLVVAAQPTRGVDVGSVEFIHNQLVAARDGGAAVLLVSAELDEVLGLSDRVAVMSDGAIVAVLDPADATRERVGLLMAGGREAG
jgi:simple sugar transport system ATP-binding protein